MRIQIDFIKMDVHSDADNWPNGAGEIYYEFKVDNDVVAARPRNQHISVSSGQSFALNGTYVVEREPHQSFTVFGTVSEADGTLSWADDHAGSFSTTYSGLNGWNPGLKSVRLNGNGLDVTVHYQVTVL